MAETQGRSRGAGGGELAVEPADQITIGDVANKEKQAVRSLIQPAVAQRVRWQRTDVKAPRIGARAGTLDIAAAAERRIGHELRAQIRALDTRSNIRPRGVAVARDVALRHTVSDALVAELRHQPTEQGRGIVPPNGSQHAVAPVGVVQMFHQRRWPRHVTNVPHNCYGVVEGRHGLLTLRRMRQRCCPQISDTNRRWASLSPSMYRWVVWIDR